MACGHLAIVLHAHMPFIRHPEQDEFLEEDWLFEAITDTYLPLIRTWHNLASDDVSFRISMSITPPLLAMLGDDLLQRRCTRYLERRMALVEREVARTQGTPDEHATALEYQRRFQDAYDLYRDRYTCNLIAAFREFCERGELEILSCAATHALLPLMKTPNGVRAQVAVGAAATEKLVGARAKCMWLPECAYMAGLEEVLAAEGVGSFIVDTHGLTHARPAAAAGPYAPVACPNGVVVFGRDAESAAQVWSADEGYPGDGVYREFYRDLGFDADYEHVRPFLHADGIRRNLGIKYHRITGPVELHAKQPYDPAAALKKAGEHACHFVRARKERCEWLSRNVAPYPIVVAPFDAELFGHWWFEGPHFLERVFRELAATEETLRPVCLSEYLEGRPPQQVVRPSASSWGDKGYFQVWLNGTNDWIYRHLHQAEDRMVALALRHATGEHAPAAGGLVARALNQAARELLLAQSSDWAFLMTAGTAAPYAEKRTRNHLAQFNRLYEQINAGTIVEERLGALEAFSNIFPDMDFRVFA